MPGFPNNQSDPAGAIPVYVTGGGGSAVDVLDFSQAISAMSAATVVEENQTRRYLFIQCVTPGEAIWVNVLGATAAPNDLGSFQLVAGQTYESGSVVPAGAVSIFSANGADVTVMEG